MGGEKPENLNDFETLVGSPPHGRGKVDIAKFFFRIPGITPAWAGKRNAVGC